jgi:putative DNA primase/helicase
MDHPQSARPASDPTARRPVADWAAGLSVSTPTNYTALFHEAYPEAKQRNREWLLVCFAHDDTDPSLSVNLEKGCWTCRTCGARGHVSQLPEIRRLLAEQRPNPFARRSPDEARSKIREQCCANPAQENRLFSVAPEGPPDLGAEPGGRAPREPYATARYVYTDPQGQATMEAVRREYPERGGRERKQAWFERRDGKDGPGVEGVARTLYNLQEVLKLAAGETLCVVEGEKDVETLRRLGIVATTSPFGARSWRDDYAEPLLGKRVVLLPDNDPAGRRYAAAVAGSLRQAGQDPDLLRCVDLAPFVDEKGDVSDFLAPGDDRAARSAQLQQWIADAPPYAAAENDAATRHAEEESKAIARFEDAALACSQMGNAQRFVRRFRGRVLYVPEWDTWVVWDGQRWREDPRDLCVMERMRDVVDDILVEAQQATDSRRKETLMRWALRSQSTQEQRAALEQARIDLRAPSGQFDAQPGLLNCRNGTLDLRTGTLRSFCCEDYLTKQCPVDYDPEARSELWEGFLARAIPDPETRHFIQKCAGYTLSGECGEDVLLLVYGITRTGKGTFQGAIAKTLGSDYVATLGLEDLAEKDRMRPGSASPHLVKLRGVRMACVYETSGRLRLNAALVKTLTGGDPISARALYQADMEFLPQFTLWIASNYRPKLPEDDDAVWERLREIPFSVQIPEAERDEQVRNTLRDPAHSGAAILAWMVRGCLDWQAEGLRPPTAVRDASHANREEMNPLVDYLRERPAAEPSRIDYEEWCKREGTKPVGRNRFCKALQQMGWERRSQTWVRS